MGCSSSLGYERRRGSTSLGYGLLGAGSSSDYGQLGLRARWPSSSPRSAVVCSVSGRARVRQAFFLNGPPSAGQSLEEVRGTLLFSLPDVVSLKQIAANAKLPPQARRYRRKSATVSDRPARRDAQACNRDLGLMCEGETWTV